MCGHDAQRCTHCRHEHYLDCVLHQHPNELRLDQLHELRKHVRCDLICGRQSNLFDGGQHFQQHQRACERRRHLATEYVPALHAAHVAALYDRPVLRTFGEQFRTGHRFFGHDLFLVHGDSHDLCVEWLHQLVQLLRRHLLDPRCDDLYADGFQCVGEQRGNRERGVAGSASHRHAYQRRLSLPHGGPTRR